MKAEQLLRLVNTQKKGTNTQLWKMLSSKVINEKPAIRSWKRVAQSSSGLGKVPVHGIKKKPEGNMVGEDSPFPPSPGGPAEIKMEQGTGDEELDIAALSMESELSEDEEKLLEGNGENFLPQPQHQWASLIGERRSGSSR